MFSSPTQQRATAIGAPAPLQGIVATTPIYGTGSIGFDATVWLYNMVAGEYGCRVRSGSQEVAINVLDADGVAGEVRTLMYYNSVVAGGALDKYFATTTKGIYDITTPTDAPVLVYEWDTQNSESGWCEYLNYTNVNGDHYLLITDESNGYLIFDGTDFTQGTFTGSPKPEATDLVQITEWQNRIWFVEKNTARAWFLDPLALTGDITPLDVGSRFIKGGHLVQNTTWTLDDGAGMDDRFIQVSSAGDVLVWKGVNPTTADDLTLVGRWSVGSVPEGRRVMSTWGGEVIILTSTGVIRASALLNGMVNTPDSQVSNNIARYIRARMRDTIDDHGWSFEYDPVDGVLLILAPPSNPNKNNAIQFCLNTTTGAWSIFRDLDMICSDRNNDGMFFGTRDGRVLRFTGTADDVALPESPTNKKPITFSFMTHFSDLNNAAVWKRPALVRPAWIGGQEPSYALKIRYDFNVSELESVPPYVPNIGDLWDVGVWDDAYWEGTAESFFETVGVTGMGRHIALAVRGTTESELSYVGCDIIGDFGGML